MKIYARAVVLNYLKDGTLWGYYEGYDESSIQKNTYMQNIYVLHKSFPKSSRDSCTLGEESLSG